jgi:hypothetical protein
LFAAQAEPAAGGPGVCTLPAETAVAIATAQATTFGASQALPRSDHRCRNETASASRQARCALERHAAGQDAPESAAEITPMGVGESFARHLWWHVDIQRDSPALCAACFRPQTATVAGLGYLKANKFASPL